MEPLTSLDCQQESLDIGLVNSQGPHQKLVTYSTPFIQVNNGGFNFQEIGYNKRKWIDMHKLSIEKDNVKKRSFKASIS